MSMLDDSGLRHLIETLRPMLVPSGTIIMWSGGGSQIPNAWALCDGQNGTPDLRGRFILGSSEDHPIGEIGGSETHTLSVAEMPAHSHTIRGIETLESVNGGSLFAGGENQLSTKDSAETSETGEGSPMSILPPYYVLAYIMKL